MLMTSCLEPLSRHRCLVGLPWKRLSGHLPRNSMHGICSSIVYDTCVAPAGAEDSNVLPVHRNTKIFKSPDRYSACGRPISTPPLIAGLVWKQSSCGKQGHGKTIENSGTD